MEEIQIKTSERRGGKEETMNRKSYIEFGQAVSCLLQDQCDDDVNLRELLQEAMQYTDYFLEQRDSLETKVNDQARKLREYQRINSIVERESMKDVYY